MKVTELQKKKLEKAATNTMNTVSYKYSSMILAFEKAMNFHDSWDEKDEEGVYLKELIEKCNKITNSIDSICTSIQIDDEYIINSPRVHTDNDNSVFIASIIRSILAHLTQATTLIVAVQAGTYLRDVQDLQFFVADIVDVLIEALRDNAK